MDKKDIINKVLKPISKAGFKVFLVGGCVRDEILGKNPHDFDVVTSAMPSDLHKIFNQFSDVQSERFGITIVIIDGENVEIATLRKDCASIDSRHPEKVEFVSDIDADAARRDFTMNALFEDIDGTIHDPTGRGINDINGGRIKFVGSARNRINEDHLRVLRMFRFFATKSVKGHRFEIDAQDIGEIRDMIDSGELNMSGVSAERIGQEMRKLLGGIFAADAISLMAEWDFIRQIFPEWTDMQMTTQNPKWHKEGVVSNHTLLVCREMQKCKDHDWIDMAAALFHDVGKPAAAKIHGKKNPTDTWCRQFDHDIIGARMFPMIAKRWALTNAETELIANLIADHMKLHNVMVITHDSKRWIFLQKPHMGRLLKLCRADGDGCVTDAVEEFTLDKALADSRVQMFLNTPLPKREVTGATLIAAGMKPCEGFKKALDVAFNQQLTWVIANKGKVADSKDVERWTSAAIATLNSISKDC